MRQSRPDAAAGIVVKPLAGYLKQTQERVARRDWSTLVAEVRRRPWWLALVDEAVNLVEYFVHHEDVRRAQPGWEPRVLPDEFSAALWSRVRIQAKIALRKTPATITVTALRFGALTAGRGGPDVDLVGPPQELLLYLLGRQDNARVEVAGPDKITSRMRRARFGI